MPLPPLSTIQPSPAKKLSLAEQDRQLAKLGAEIELKILAINQKAKANKASSNARKQITEHWEQFEARLSFRVRNTKPLFRWLHLVWEWHREMLAGDKERNRLKAAVRRHDRRIDAWTREQEKEILKEWDEKRKQLKGMSVMPKKGEGITVGEK